MHPIILLLGGALLLAGKKRKRSSKISTGSPERVPKAPDGEEPPIPPGSSGKGSGGGLSISAALTAPAPYGKLWEKCKVPDGSPTGTYAAFGTQGECIVFWNPQTWILMGDFIDKEFSKLSKKKRNKICKLDDCIPNPYAPGMDSELFCEWKPNPDRERFVAKIVQAAFPQLKDYSFPTTKQDPFFPKMVWTFTSNLFASQICGIGRVT